MVRNRLCFATCSLGPPTEPLANKLTVLAKNGFDSIELSMPDLQGFAKQYNDGKEVDERDFDTLIKAAKEVGKLCVQHNLKVALMQPFAHFEGWDHDSPAWQDALLRLRGWIGVMLACGCDTLQVGSSDHPSVAGRSREAIVHDLRQLADELAKYNLRCAYENWCWSVHAPTWKDVWDICHAVGKSNFLLCLDTFQLAGSAWADPSWSDGLTQHAGGQAALDAELDKSLDELVRTVPANKIYMLQISDAFKADPPISAAEHGAHPKSTWSQSYRPPPFNGGYLPVQKVTDAIRKTGFDGLFSIETFDGQPVLYVAPDEYAQRCMKSLKKLLHE